MSNNQKPFLTSETHHSNWLLTCYIDRLLIGNKNGREYVLKGLYELYNLIKAWVNIIS
jgi:hypothetical protein